MSSVSDHTSGPMIAAAQPRATLPWFGTRRDQLEALATGVGALLVTATYVLVARGFDTPTTAVEAVSLWASLACVWLARVENIWCMQYGLASVMLLGWYLLDIELVGQGWLQYVFYVPVQMVGWWAWSHEVDRENLPDTLVVGCAQFLVLEVRRNCRLRSNSEPQLARATCTSLPPAD